MKPGWGLLRQVVPNPCACGEPVVPGLCVAMAWGAIGAVVGAEPVIGVDAVTGEPSSRVRIQCRVEPLSLCVIHHTTLSVTSWSRPVVNMVQGGTDHYTERHVPRNQQARSRRDNPRQRNESWTP